MLLRLLNTELEQSWLTKCVIYLLYHIVNLLKKIRNDWLTEQMGKLAF